jgi:hypothetical protein
MQGCWSILLGWHRQAKSRPCCLHYTERAVLLCLLLSLHSTWGNDGTLCIGLNTPGGKYFARDCIS